MQHELLKAVPLLVSHIQLLLEIFWNPFAAVFPGRDALHRGPTRRWCEGCHGGVGPGIERLHWFANGTPRLTCYPWKHSETVACDHLFAGDFCSCSDFDQCGIVDTVVSANLQLSNLEEHKTFEWSSFRQDDDVSKAFNIFHTNLPGQALTNPGFTNWNPTLHFVRGPKNAVQLACHHLAAKVMFRRHRRIPLDANLKNTFTPEASQPLPTRGETGLKVESSSFIFRIIYTYLNYLHFFTHITYYLYNLLVCRDHVCFKALEFERPRRCGWKGATAPWSRARRPSMCRLRLAWSQTVEKNVYISMLSMLVSSCLETFGPCTRCPRLDWWKSLKDQWTLFHSVNFWAMCCHCFICETYIPA